MTKRGWGGWMFVAALLASGTALGADPPYGGEFWSRPKLTGDWGGLRDRWAEHGLTIDLFIQIAQVVLAELRRRITLGLENLYQRGVFLLQAGG
ncbi:MAG: hypothetical protein ACREYC_06410 [Gammaproteobacteria bacterium]